MGAPRNSSLTQPSDADKEELRKALAGQSGEVALRNAIASMSQNTQPAGPKTTLPPTTISASEARNPPIDPRGMGQLGEANDGGGYRGGADQHSFAGSLRAQKERGEPAAMGAGDGTFAPDPARQQAGAQPTWGGGGTTSTDRTIHHGVPMTPEVMAAQQGFAQHANAAADMTQTADERAADIEEKRQNAMALENHGMRAERAVSEGRRGIQTYEAEQAVRDKKAELAETPTTVHEYFSKQDTLGKITSIVGLAMGGLAAGLNHRGGNDFLDHINRTIASQMGKKKGELDFANDHLKDLTPKQEKERATEKEKYLQGLEAVKLEFDAQAAKNGSQTAKARAEASKAQIDHIIFEQGLKGMEVSGDKVIEHTKESSGGAGGPFKEADLKWMAEQEQKLDLPGLESNLARYNAADQASGGKGMSWLGDKVHSASPTAFGAVYGGKASEREQAFAGLENSALHTLSGAAVSPTEMTRLMAQFRAAHTPESRNAAIGAIRDAAMNQRRNINAGVSDADIAERERRLGRSGGGAAQTPARPPMVKR